MKFILYLLLFAVIIIFYNCHHEKEIGITKHEDSNNPVYSIDTAAIKLPKNFIAGDPITLFDYLRILKIYNNSSKEEFETSEEYKMRIHNLIKKAYNTKMIDNLTLDSLFTIQLKDSTSNWLSYDADKEIMKAKIDLMVPFITRPYIFKEDLKEINKNFNSSALCFLGYKKYLGSDYYYALEFGNHNKFKKYFCNSIGNVDKSLTIELSMNKECAKKEKENLRLIATILIIKPWYQDSVFLYNEFYNIIYANVVQFWIYNYKTGEIYLKVKA